MKTKYIIWKKKIFQIILTIIFIWLIGMYLFQNQDLLIYVQNLNIIDAIVLISFHIGTLFVLGLLNMILVKRIDPKVSFSDSILLQYVNNLLNNLIPKGGSAFRAVYLQNRYHFPYSHFLSTLAGMFVLNIAINSIFALLSFLFIYIDRGFYSVLLIMFYLGILILSLVIIGFNPSLNNRNNRILKALDSIVEGWKLLKTNSRDLYWLILLGSTNLLMKSFQMKYLYTRLGVQAGIFEMIYLTTVAIIMQLINLTPGGIGAREALYALSDQIVSIPSSILVLGSLVQRGILFVSALLFGGISLLILQQRMQNSDISAILNYKDSQVD